MRKPERRRWISTLATMLLVAFIVGGIITTGYGLRAPVDPWRASDVTFAFSLLAYSALGWLIAVRLPRNSLGWIYLAFPLVLEIGALSEELALRAAQAGSSAGAALWLIAATWLSYFGYLLLNGPVFLLFPDGRFPGHRFRWALWGVVALFLIFGVISTIGSDVMCVRRIGATGDACFRTVENPLGLVRGASLREDAEMLLGFVVMLALGVSLTAIVVRYRRSTGDARQQIKWVAWMAALGVPIMLGFYGGQEVLGLIPRYEWSELPYIAFISIGLPAAIGVAIFKYRLYDIDLIIRRTLIYGVLTATLALLYFGGVVVIQQILRTLTGQSSEIAIVVSTLAIAALFNPLRRRVQDTIDRRLYRRKYDAAKVLAEFAATARDEVELDKLTARLVEVVEETMQPESVSLWLKPVPGMDGKREKGSV